MVTKTAIEQLGLPKPTEQLRKKLLEEEKKMRKKQPTSWTKIKYRKYAVPVKKKQ